MGSLMAGWNSCKTKPNKGLVRHNSLTNGEIENFWKIKRQIEDEHLKEAAEAASKSQEETLVSPVEITGSTSYQKLAISHHSHLMASKSFSGRENMYNNHFSVNIEVPDIRKGWWRRSHSAYLNEPSVIEPEARANNYEAQFQITSPGARRGLIMGGVGHTGFEAMERDF